MAFLFPPHGVVGEPVIISLAQFMEDDASKNLVSHAIRNVVAKVGASGVVTILEAWMSPAAVSQKWGLRPSEDPDRLDVLKVTWEFRVPGESEKITGYWVQLFHHEGDNVVLDGAIEESPSDEVGRFANFLE